MRRVALVIAALAACVLLSGCASVTRGWSEQVQFDSAPIGAEVRTVIVNAAPDADTGYGPVGEQPPKPGPACVTPCMATVGRKDELLVTFSKPGYRPQTVTVGTRVAGAGVAGVAGNILLGGVVGAAVDVGSGAALEHYPNPVKVDLQPLPAAKPAVPRRGGPAPLTN